MQNDVIALEGGPLNDKFHPLRGGIIPAEIGVEYDGKTHWYRIAESATGVLTGHYMPGRIEAKPLRVELTCEVFGVLTVDGRLFYRTFTESHATSVLSGITHQDSTLVKGLATIQWDKPFVSVGRVHGKDGP